MISHRFKNKMNLSLCWQIVNYELKSKRRTTVKILFLLGTILVRSNEKQSIKYSWEFRKFRSKYPVISKKKFRNLKKTRNFVNFVI